HVQREQQVLQLAHRRAGRENAHHVKAKRGGELETGQQQDLVEQAAIFVEAIGLVGHQALEALQQLQLGNLIAQAAQAADGVVVGKRNNVQAARFGGLENVQI